ncbi:MAG: VOC family protein [Bryobacteraceae bacterium]
MKDFTTYLTFDGNCRDAMTFYKKCLEGELDIIPFSQAPNPMPAEAKDRTMHARLTKGKGTIMASDTMPGMPFTLGNNFSISLDCDTAEEIERLFNAFGEKGKVTMPLQKTFWAARFGMLTDQFGISWMFNLNEAGHG